MKSNGRVADMLVRLVSGEVLDQADLKKQYGVSLRTCQRDMAYIRQALAEYNVGVIDDQNGTYCLTQQSDVHDLEMVLAASHVLLGSRALTGAELNRTLDFLSTGLSPSMQTLVHEQLTLSRGSYTPLSRAKPLLARLREISTSIDHNEKLVFTYQSSHAGEPTPRVQHAQPVALFFETYYFYVAMWNRQRHSYLLYRLDRIVDILTKTTGERLAYAQRFSLQDHRRQTYLLDTGELTRIRFVYRNYVQTALDYFPGSYVVDRHPDGSHVIEAYVKVGGAMIWLLSQGTAVKVLSPLSLVKQMRTTLAAVLAQYPKIEDK
ncbi:helix-turn-helix transcriptional regulator [Levilactobacillus suantsaii]|uniref:helix-turn-helix transcriptional regulator n=1 Tax=Levilactobacillus suantsaii TaxID=2292255 RepID=UPI001F212063|nr:WYL domain-containing protein [Levilactobacillus suantsaii]